MCWITSFIATQTWKPTRFLIRYAKSTNSYFELLIQNANLHHKYRQVLDALIEPTSLHILLHAPIFTSFKRAWRYQMKTSLQMFHIVVMALIIRMIVKL